MYEKEILCGNCNSSCFNNLLTPVRMNLKDGGSVRYKALAYEVTKIHRLAPEVEDVKPYIDGFEIKILGMTVYRETY